MADEEATLDTEETTEETTEEKPKSKKNLIPIVGGFVLLFILSTAGNFIHLKMTYVPPEPEEIEEPVVHVEEKHPIMTIDLGEDEEIAGLVVEHVAMESDSPESDSLELELDSLEKAIEDSMDSIREDSIKAVIKELYAGIHEGDSLLTATINELEKTKKLLKTQIAEEDSINLKRSIKLAKIIESMPSKEAARMLEPLDDLMVLDVLMRLKQRQAAKIMAEFSAQRSARLSEVILRPLVRG